MRLSAPNFAFKQPTKKVHFFTMGLISPKPKPPRTSGDQLLLCALQALRRRTAYHDIADAQAGAAAAYR